MINYVNNIEFNKTLTLIINIRMFYRTFSRNNKWHGYRCIKVYNHKTRETRRTR